MLDAETAYNVGFYDWLHTELLKDPWPKIIKNKIKSIEIEQGKELKRNIYEIYIFQSRIQIENYQQRIKDKNEWKEEIILLTGKNSIKTILL